MEQMEKEHMKNHYRSVSQTAAEQDAVLKKLKIE
jgi:hypothetical protein